MNKMRWIVALLLLCMLVTGLLSGCGSKEIENRDTLEDFAEAKIGVMTGSSQAVIAKEKFPDAKLVYFTRPADLVLAVEQGKIDCYMLGSPFLAATRWEGARVKRIDESVAQGDIAFAFPKNTSSDPLRMELNSFLQQAEKDGTIQNLQEKWFGDTEPVEHPDYASLPGEKGVIRLAAVAENKPLIYRYKNQCTGIEMELLTLFARQYGYRLEVEVVPFDSVIMGMATGKYDMTSAGLQITPERSESVNFSEPYMQFDVVLVVRDEGSQQPEKMTLADIENATIGIMTGTNWDIVAQTEFPNAQRKYFSSGADAILALQQGKIDTFFADKSVFVGMQWENVFLDCIDEPLVPISNSLILAKEGYDENLLKQINAFVAKAKSDGTMDRLAEKWFGNTEPEEHPDYVSLPGENGVLRIAVSDSMKPTTYQKENHYTGYEVDFLTLFAKEYGYALEVVGMSFDALIPSVASGKCDIGACGITVTPERMESVTFADSHFETYGVAVVCKNADGGAVAAKVQSLEDLQNGKIAILTGSIWDGVAQKELPGAERKYFSAMADMFLSLGQGKVDGILGDRTFYVNASWEDMPVVALEETVGAISCGFMLAGEDYDPVLMEQLNDFIANARKDGTMDALSEKWFADTEPEDHPDYQSLPGENGTLRIAVDDTAKPMTYRTKNSFTGFDVDLLTAFARAYGYRLEFQGMAFHSLIPTVSGGKCDIGACGTAITPERAESVSFTDCYLQVDGVMIVSRNVDVEEQAGFLDRVAESFEKTFIREDRWKMIVSGVGVTMLISICATIAGTVLGFSLYMLSRSDVRAVRGVAKGVARVYSRIVAGTPVVVILMILFYVIFGSVRNMSGVVVSIIGFTLTFGAFVYGHMTVAVGSIDPGQTEAAYALGYPKNKAFFRVILPQAMGVFLPSYCGQAVELIKATAVVGYVAVNDLTKMGDIIRSNTYEAFFPLIATAVIYFILTWLLSLVLQLLKKRFEPRRRREKDILKGVKTV